MNLPLIVTLVIAISFASSPTADLQQDPIASSSSSSSAVGSPAQETAEAHSEPATVPGVFEGDDGKSEDMREADDALAYEGAYQSPYSLRFHFPMEELLPDAHTWRGSPGAQARIPERDWYSPTVLRLRRGWGPLARRFEQPEFVVGKSVEWKRERLVASGARFIGYGYQHHHIFDWDPPAGWPWNSCCTGHQGKGVDCSTFTSWNYNWGLGIHVLTNVVAQGANPIAQGPAGELRAERINRPEGRPGDWYDQLCATLKTGDLLFIRMHPDQPAVVHAIMWVGDVGQSPDGTPLIIDSTGGEVKDSNGHKIPSGIHLRPFRKGGWYHTCFSHAHRWLK
jgi:hypothetical protein